MSVTTSATLDDALVRQRRDAVLGERRWYPCRETEVFPLSAERLVSAPGIVRDRVQAIGVALFELSRALRADEFVAVAAALGQPEQETEPSLMDRVTNGVILNLKPNSTGSPSEYNQPFTPRALTYHTEGSRRPLGTAPSYLLFQCVESPVMDRGGQTLIRSIDDTLASLSVAAATVLRGTVLCPESTNSPVIRDRGGRCTLNLRDPAPAEFRWRSSFGRNEVFRSLSELLRVVYDKGAAVGIPWCRNLLLVLDNHRWLHARTEGHPDRRHLQRIRIRAAEGVA